MPLIESLINQSDILVGFGCSFHLMKIWRKFFFFYKFDQNGQVKICPI